MSKYHSNCSKSNDNKKGSLTTKPFCDCKDCSCKNCPDILQMLSITVTENSCDFGSKGKREEKRSLHDMKRASLLNVLNEDRECGCEVVARALRSNVHMNLGLAQGRDAPAAEPQRTTPGTSKDVVTKK